MTLRVIVIGTGGVGAHALRAVLRNPRYDLTGFWVSSGEKAGKDGHLPERRADPLYRSLRLLDLRRRRGR
ncbi:hypothetical protein ACEWX3_12800 [Mycobacterium sp. G7A2]|uniref:hypothetical protein n=1 Tax=Mycobacterium sp. G7A2 TaxID=3317307 RepID=UPI0035A8BE81